MKSTLFLFTAIIIAQLVHAQDTSDDETTGNWTTGNTWVDNGAPGHNDMDQSITIDGYVTLTAGPLEFGTGTGHTLTVNEGDTLIVDSGTVSRLRGGNTVVVNGLFIVTGDLNLNNGTNFTIGASGVLVVGGTLNGFGGGGNTLVNNGEMFVGSDSNEFAEDLTDEIGTGTINNITEAFNYVESNSTTLPVELLSFEANLVQSSVNLRWSTASELNNHGFFIEKSDNGLDYEQIQFVRGVGTSNIVNRYEYTDSYFSSSAFYRLTQLDFDGSSESFKSIYVQHSSEQIKIYPNPVVNQNIRISGPPQMVYSGGLYSSGGSRIMTYTGLTLNIIENELNSISQDLIGGIYLLNLQSVTGNVFLKIQIQH